MLLSSFIPKNTIMGLLHSFSLVSGSNWRVVVIALGCYYGSRSGISDGSYM